MWVSPFRYLRIYGYLLLPAAFRSLSRLSSALSAKASTLRSLCLTFVIRGTIVDGGFLMTVYLSCSVWTHDSHLECIALHSSLRLVC